MPSPCVVARYFSPTLMDKTLTRSPATLAVTLRRCVHKSPREFGKDSSLWTMEMAAEVSFEEGLTKERVSGETVRATLARMGVRWQRAKHWITSPDPLYERKKEGAIDRCILRRVRPIGLWALRMSVGGAEQRSRICTALAKKASLCVWSSSLLKRTTPTRRPSPATGCICPNSNRVGLGLWTVAR